MDDDESGVGEQAEIDDHSYSSNDEGGDQDEGYGSSVTQLRALVPGVLMALIRL